MLLVLYYLRNPYVAAQLGSRSLKINRSFKFGASDITFLMTRVRVRRRCGSRPRLLRNSLLDPLHRLSNFRVSDQPPPARSYPYKELLTLWTAVPRPKTETSVLLSSAQPPRRLLKMALARPLLVLRMLRPWRRDRCSGT